MLNFRIMRRVLTGAVTSALVSFGLVQSACAQDFEERVANWQEDGVVMPAAPVEASLREFYVSATTPNTFMIDRDTLTVGADGVVRYVLVVRTPGGAENITFEGIRCNTGERRIYASARKGGEWASLRNSEWVPISNNTYNRPRAALAAELFCDGPAPPRDAEEVLRRMDRGYAVNPKPLQGAR